MGPGLAKWLVLTGQTLGAEEALAIGLVDMVVPHEKLDGAIGELIAAGPSAVRSLQPVPETHRPIADFFDSHSVDELLRGLDNAPDDARLAKAVKRIGSKAPVALRLAADLIDRGVELPIDDGLALELAHLHEIFSTKDAYEGLSTLGKKAPVFVGR